MHNINAGMKGKDTVDVDEIVTEEMINPSPEAGQHQEREIWVLIVGVVVHHPEDGTSALIDDEDGPLHEIEIWARSVRTLDSGQGNAH